MLARDIMTVDPVVVTPDAAVYEAAAIMRDAKVGFVPVVDDCDSMRLQGVLTDRDVAVRCVAARRSCDGPVRECMTPAPIATVAPDADVHEVVALMERDQVRRVPVVDRDGRLVGVIAQADLALWLGPAEPESIEELVERISAPSSVVPPFASPAPGRGTLVS